MISKTPRLGRRHALALAATSFAALPLALPNISRAQGSAQSGATTVKDALNRTVTLKAPAERIILGFNYEEFTAVAGAAGWDRVAGFGRSMWTDWRPAVFKRYAAAIPRLAALPEVGNTEDSTFSMEKVLSLRPDLVILPAWAFKALGPQTEQLASLGVPVLVIDYNSEIPERHVASTVAMAQATGNEERGRAVAALYMDKLADIARRVAGVAVRPRAYVELGMGGADVVGNTYSPVNMWGRLLDRAGAQNIAAGHIAGDFAPLSPEYVLAADPEAVFITGSSWVGHPQAVQTGFDADMATTRASLAPYARRQGWPGLAAVRDGQVYALEHGLSRALFDYCPTYFIAKALHPAAFADIDPVDELRRYHEQYLPVPFKGTWMTRLAPQPA